MREKTFDQQRVQADFIKARKQKEWLEACRHYAPNYIAEHLFYPSVSVLTSMLKPDPELGYIYDPETLREGVDLLMKILSFKDSRSTSKEKLASMYASFADPQTRITYLRHFIDYLELYPILGGKVIADLETIKPTLTDPEEIEINQNITNNIKTRYPEFAKPTNSNTGYQPE